ncbi:MAG: alpha/beta hydrolase [Planctomycetia bacterium]
MSTHRPTRISAYIATIMAACMTACRAGVVLAAIGIVGLAIIPRSARGESMNPPGSRALRDLDHAPHLDVPESEAPDVWLVSTRRLPSTRCVPLAPGMTVERFVDQGCGGRCTRGRWEQADMESLFGTDDHGRLKPILIFIHGNRYEGYEARQQGLLLARHCAAACPNAGPVRTVIYSWPSEKDGILLKDGRAKLSRAYSEGRYLAWLLGQIDPSRPVGIVGYSFGALITLEALGDLVDAEDRGRSDLQPWRGRPAQTNLMFIAAAVRCDAFAPRGPYRETLECVDRVSLIVNPRDKALNFFPILSTTTQMEALGHTSMPRHWMPEHVEFSAIDAQSIIGKKHGLPLYLASPSLTKHLCAGATCGLEE